VSIPLNPRAVSFSILKQEVREGRRQRAGGRREFFQERKSLLLKKASSPSPHTQHTPYPS
jgi:hypothetical protein